eukprot:8092706-Karenia_brevis.AAC.1
MQRPLPKLFRVFSDNAPGETKNQTMFKFLAWLCHKKIFACTEAAQQRVGHSHNRQDQRFAVGMAVVGRIAHLPLETDQDLAKIITEKVKPIAGLPQHELKTTVSGHTSTKAKKDACITAPHVFRFVLRSNLESYCFTEAPHLDTAEIFTSWTWLPPDPNDVVCITKKFIASVELSQPPFVFCPNDVLSKLDFDTLALAPL